MGIYLLLALIVVLLLAWLLSEFQGRIGLRIALGGLAIFAAFGVAYVVGKLEQLNYNAWYGHATQTLVAAEIEALEAGQHDMLNAELARFQGQFHPSYESRARYDQLAEQAATRIKAALGQSTTPQSAP